MLTLFFALVPVFAVIALGYAAKHYHFLSHSFWQDSEKLAYFVLLPVLLFFSIVTAEIHSLNVAFSMSAAVIGALLLMLPVVALFRRLLKLQTKDFTSIFQGAVQTNAAYVGLPVSLALLGKEGFILFAVMLALVVPAANAYVLTMLIRYDPAGRGNFRQFLRRVTLHPLMLACLGGLMVKALEITLPMPLLKILEILSNAALPIGLLIVGAALDIHAMRGTRRPIVLSSALKLVVLPCMVMGFCLLLGMEGIQAQAAVLYATLPTSAASYLMAKRHGGNAPLTAGIIVAETVFSALTIVPMIRLAQFIFPAG